jgi:hypothetical protein
MRNIKDLVLIALLVLLALFLNAIGGAAQSMSGGNYKITSSVQASGGGTGTGGGNKVIEGTAGQSSAGGPLTGGPISHTSGFWPTTLAQSQQQSGTTAFKFSAANYSVQEDLGALAITIVRTGDVTAPATVDYWTNDGVAKQKTDFEFAAGTLKFASGETAKVFQLLINEDIYSEGAETLTLSLSNPSGAELGPQSSATVTINDDANEPPVNSIDDAIAFVYTHYHDFLNREPDPAGLAFWTQQITSCGNDAQCVEARRINVSASFFLSIEFQETAYLLYLMQRESFATMPMYAPFMRDLQEVSRGVIVNSPGWQQQLSNNQQRFADNWVSRPEFKAAYDNLSNDAYVSALYQNAGVAPPPAEKGQFVAALNTASMNRASVLIGVAANATFRQQEMKPAFVLMEYFGYLRRDPNALPDADLSGYNFWLSKLNQFGGNYLDAEMIKAFITSFEYRTRFGQ